MKPDSRLNVRLTEQHSLRLQPWEQTSQLTQIPDWRRIRRTGIGYAHITVLVIPDTQTWQAQQRQDVRLFLLFSRGLTSCSARCLLFFLSVSIFCSSFYFGQ